MSNKFVSINAMGKICLKDIVSNTSLDKILFGFSNSSNQVSHSIYFIFQALYLYKINTCLQNRVHITKYKITDISILLRKKLSSTFYAS